MVVGDALPFAVGVAFLAGVAELDFGIGIGGDVEGTVDALHHAVGVEHVFDLAVVEDEQGHAWTGGDAGFVELTMLCVGAFDGDEEAFGGGTHVELIVLLPTGVEVAADGVDFFAGAFDDDVTGAEEVGGEEVFGGDDGAPVADPNAAIVGEGGEFPVRGGFAGVGIEEEAEGLEWQGAASIQGASVFAVGDGFDDIVHSEVHVELGPRAGEAAVVVVLEAKHVLE